MTAAFPGKPKVKEEEHNLIISQWTRGSGVLVHSWGAKKVKLVDNVYEHVFLKESMREEFPENKRKRV